ncbi:hypothetical protein AT5G22794 [Arabidopsis thaliana]|uniref:Uncharacterized protein n=1 Tax=Arabidopsis thaliana TaxID=3702 RepID=F4KBB9_ARATH|nr:uncharacterized protein AT5G22794 [Arabidopsis thaliana]AED93080.1 hypothetical protein AT5G22794 [Arabidopsis thaliana]|eukprot:NP_001154733.1 hypothetical protein AT5G22794 [Arabidopsis thaliana]
MICDLPKHEQDSLKEATVDDAVVVVGGRREVGYGGCDGGSNWRLYLLWKEFDVVSLFFCNNKLESHISYGQAQESLENVLIDLYKKGGRTEEQVELLKLQLWMIYQEEAFNGKPAKIARSHGRKFQVTVEKETSRMLLKPCIGNTSDRARCKQGLFKYIQNQSLLKVDESDDEPLDTKQISSLNLFQQDFDVEGLLIICGKSLDGDEDNDGDYMNAVSHGHSKASSIFKSKKSKASL